MNLLRRTILCAVLATAALAAPARTALDFFTDLPMSVLSLLSRTTRQDMIDYYNAGLATPSDNIYGGKSRILRVSDNSIDLLASTNATATIAVLPAGSDTIVALIETMRTPTPDSSVSFYRTSDWTKMAVTLPTLRDFLTPEARKERLTAADFPEMSFYTVEFDPETAEFIFRDRTAQHYSVPEGSSVEYRALNFLRPQITRVLQGSKLIEPKK
ncbi:MAG: DUF3256 family protein [Muribaculaceae bacterium]|nr:DUF3256 family protein [Muribaculaceae bacterium]